MNTEKDPVFSACMSFLAADMQRSPGCITPLEAAALARIRSLVGDVNTSPEEDLGNEALS